MKANKDTMILDLLQMHPDVAGRLMRHGLHCIGCMLAANETIEQACQAHGLSVDLLLDDINSFLGEEEAAASEENPA